MVVAVVAVVVVVVVAVVVGVAAAAAAVVVVVVVSICIYIYRDVYIHPLLRSSYKARTSRTNWMRMMRYLVGRMLYQSQAAAEGLSSPLCLFLSNRKVTQMCENAYPARSMQRMHTPQV